MRIELSIIAFACACAAVVSACDKPNDGAAGAPSSSATTAATPAKSVASPSASAEPAASASSAPAAAAAGTAWAGTYKSGAGSLYYAENFKDKKWAGDESAQGIGDGNITLTSTPEGQVQGEADGAIGPVTLIGTLSDGELRARVIRKEGSDDGFWGTALGTVQDDKIEGEMKLSLAKANVIRKATFTIAKKR